MMADKFKVGDTVEVIPEKMREIDYTNKPSIGEAYVIRSIFVSGLCSIDSGYIHIKQEHIRRVYDCHLKVIKDVQKSDATTLRSVATKIAARFNPAVEEEIALTRRCAEDGHIEDTPVCPACCAAFLSQDKLIEESAQAANHP